MTDKKRRLMGSGKAAGNAGWRKGEGGKTEGEGDGGRGM